MKEELELERQLAYAEADNKKIKVLILKIKLYEIRRKTMKNFLERLKSPVIWCEIVIAIAQILKYAGVYEMPNELLSAIQDLISYGFYIFAGVNNPTDRKHF